MLKKSLAAAIALTVAASTAHAFSKDELTIWVGGDKAHQGISKVGELFEEDMGIKVRVEIPENITDRFQQAAATGQGPDILLWAHDRYGEWAQSGLLAEVKPSKSFYDGIVDLGWQATTINGKIYGYPVAMEAIGLIYNKDIIKEAPKTYEEMFTLHDELKKKDKEMATIMWDQVQPYFSMPMLASNGGYVFKETQSGYDVKTVGVNNKGAKKGAQMFAKMIEKDVLPRGVDYGVMDSTFNNGKAAMMVTGPWAWSNLDKSDINYGVAPLPTIDGSPARAFVGVWGATINNATPNKDLAQEFLENYLLSKDGLKTMNNDVPLGAVANKAFMEELKSDPRIAATYEGAMNGLLMPNVPEMGKFWSSMEAALNNIANGREEVNAALDNAAKRIAN
ncbi:maltose/maltodextrin ABC transporter substrate-binding protein MalE [Endozoicomonas euniceicola]|uniref:Maltodextrin-binding protein n=1 Tax=Endozoicomonas euniceicola TaxID=1234143 RepID=A0ABY6GY52_9GAMM|nr:maltose/maltodextrin ABC transporter substrate-binding protein MalE [Endozoicomonas euniceicola]UYM17319.1 maltose/maltodextrin ABC transporter substrate-binding protein MalE [Endozoicomonas euniceicola]